jgi:hypothetical protein
MAGVGLIRFQLSSPGARALLRSAPVAADLLARAERVKVAATPQLAALDSPYPALKVTGDIGPGRAGATVTGVPLPLERSRRILGGALDAAG